jgi:hypothetical protein
LGTERLLREGLLSEAFEALSPSVGRDVGELREVEADAGLGECAERDESEEEPKSIGAVLQEVRLLFSSRTAPMWVEDGEQGRVSTMCWRMRRQVLIHRNDGV